MVFSRLSDIAYHILELVYDRYCNYDPREDVNPANSAWNFSELTNYLEEKDDEILRKAAEELADMGLLFTAGIDSIMVNFYKLDVVEDLLKNKGIETAINNVERRNKILRNIAEAAGLPVHVYQLMEDQGIGNPDEQRKIVSILARSGFIQRTEPTADAEVFYITERGRQHVKSPEKELVRRPPQVSRIRLPYVILFIDMEGSTDRASIYGDALLTELQGILIDTVTKNFAGLQPERNYFLGDGYLIAFDNDRMEGIKKAVELCYRVLKDILDCNKKNEQESYKQIHLRIGLHAAEVDIKGANIMGVEIAKARRITDLSQELLGLHRPWVKSQCRLILSEEAHQQCIRKGLHIPAPEFESPYLKLKGLPGAHKVFRLPVER